MTDNFSSHFSPAWLNKILLTPEKPISGMFENIPYEANIVIPHYKEKVSTYYNEQTNGNIDSFCKNNNFPTVFGHFGIAINFEKPLQLRLHDDEMTMIDSLHYLIKEVGSVIIKNAYLDTEHRSMGHRNRFPQLNFHVDRSENQPTHYSMYTRNPFDEEQKHPRNSSTLFIPSVLGHLQSLKEKIIEPSDINAKKGSHTIFTKDNMSELFNNIIIEHAWNEKEGTGEISMLDNTTCLHASYYTSFEKGYKIGVRYVA